VKKSRSIRIVIADDHSIVREGLRAVINRESDMEVCAEARNWDEAMEQILGNRPEVAVVDLHMGETPVPEVIEAVREKSPDTRIVIYSAFSSDEEVYQVFSAGAHGYVLKGESGREDLLLCIRAVARGETWIHPAAAARLAERMTSAKLTHREMEVLRLMVVGKSNKEIGSSLDVTAGTVKVHVNHILQKLGVTGRVEAIGAALRRGLVLPRSLWRAQSIAKKSTLTPRENISKAVGPAKPTSQLQGKN
jgi:two-component system, NarL family, response regulator